MADNISSVAIEDKMKDAYLSYSLSVIVGRALPDVRDGLKPVHRRILYAAEELGLTADKPHKKSARIVGEVLGKFHPHGDMAVYNAMVRMAQPFNQRYLLVDGHGNFGSVDGDSPAAMRYTEARLTDLSRELLKDIKANTVDFTDNFDGSLQEPMVLPSRIPNLLVNGSSGIAVGMSTSIPPHNIGEVIDALKYLLKHPGAKLKTIMKYIPGPDFPTGAKIIGNEEIKKAYKTGKGNINLRAKAEIEKNSSGRKQQIIVTELPFQVNKAKLIEEIANLVKKGKIEDITDIRDETDQEGLRVVIELKQGVESKLILNRLYKYTYLQTRFRINLLALKDNQPEVMNLKTILQHFIDFRRQVITRRTNFKLDKARERYHVLDGLIKAISKLDLVISIIRNSDSTEEARNNLQEKLDITERQARAILQMRLQRLVGMEIEKLKTEIKELATEIENYEKILNDRSELDEVLRDELSEIKKIFDDKRRTTIIEDKEQAVIDKKDLIEEKKAVISLSYRQKIKRADEWDSVRAAKNDYITHISSGVSFDNILIFTQTGNVYSHPIHKLPEHHGLSTGDNLKKFIKLSLKENVVGLLCLNNEIQKKNIVLATEQGIVKKTIGKEYKTSYSSIKAIKLKDNDQVVNVAVTDGKQEILLGTRAGKTIRFAEDSVNSTGRNTLGSIGIKLEANDKVKDMNIVKTGEYVISVSETGKANKINIAEFKPQNRNGKGVNTTSSNEYQITDIIIANPDDFLLLTTTNENLFSIQVADIVTTQRPGYMYSIIDLENKDKVSEVFRLPLQSKNENDTEKHK